MTKQLEALIASIKPDLAIALDKSRPQSESFPAIDRLSDALTLDVLSSLIAALEQAQQQKAKDFEIKARLCNESNSLHDRLKAAEKRIAELEASPLAVKLTTPASTFDAAAAIRACMDEFPLAVHDVVEECAVIAENTIRAAGGTVSEGE